MPDAYTFICRWHCILFFICAIAHVDNAEHPMLLLVSFDGFRWDYVDKTTTPNIHRLMKRGVHAAQGLKNAFATITAPNHYTIVTGVYEETHGIISNGFFNPALNATFDYYLKFNATNPKFFEAATPPIWYLNDHANNNRATGCMMWLGCDVPIFNHTILHRQSRDDTITWVQRVDALLNWFLDAKAPTNLGILYIEEPDETGHKYGPNHVATLNIIRKLDKLVGYILFSLKKVALLHRVNLILTADHGMTNVSPGSIINLDLYVNYTWYVVNGATSGPNWNIIPKPGYEEKIYAQLLDVPHMRVFKKTDIPMRFHYANAPSVMPIQLLADLGYLFQSRASRVSNTFKTRTDSLATTENQTVGAHGYDNNFADMHPYFIGYGPAFKEDFSVNQFETVDLYSLMCYILEVTPPPNNGSFSRVRQLLKDDGAQWTDRFL